MKKTRYQNATTQWTLALTVLLFTTTSSALDLSADARQDQRPVACALNGPISSIDIPGGGVIICPNTPKGCFPPDNMKSENKVDIKQMTATQCNAAGGVAIDRTF